MKSLVFADPLTAFTFTRLVEKVRNQRHSLSYNDSSLIQGLAPLTNQLLITYAHTMQYIIQSYRPILQHNSSIALFINPEQSLIFENSSFFIMVFCIPKAFFFSSIKSVKQIGGVTKLSIERSNIIYLFICIPMVIKNTRV